MKILHISVNFVYIPHQLTHAYWMKMNEHSSTSTSSSAYFSSLVTDPTEVLLYTREWIYLCSMLMLCFVSCLAWHGLLPWLGLTSIRLVLFFGVFFSLNWKHTNEIAILFVRGRAVVRRWNGCGCWTHCFWSGRELSDEIYYFSWN